tara:strand:+ start:247429 stop:248811 length:1383 start_codon:yes stop_codon:yes gene_type:complete
MSIEKLIKIEKNYNTELLVLKDQPIWPVIRLPLNEHLRSQEDITSRTFDLKNNINFKTLRTLFFGIRHLTKFRSHKYWFFSSSERRKKINDIYEDRVIEGLVKKYKGLSIENPHPLGKHLHKNIGETKVISRSLFYLGELIFSKLFTFNLKINNEQVIKTILDDYQLNFNYKVYLRKYFGQYLFYKTILKFHKPDIVFLVYAASSMGMVKALKEKKIPVVELQHGIINEKHLAYNIFKNFGKCLYPDYLLTYGETELDFFHNKNYFISPKNVFPVGYYFLEKNKELKKIKNEYSSYKKIIVFSFQEVFEKQIFDFLNQTAILDDTVCYVVIPRNSNKDYSKMKFQSNVIINKKINIYEALKICDIHATINSSCAIEAMSLGIPNILYNYKNWSSSYFKSIFDSDNYGCYVTTPQEFYNIIKEHKYASREQILKKGETFFKKGFMQNFEEVLSQRILKNKI